MRTSTYLIALGSNRRTHFGSPRRTVASAIETIGAAASSRIIESAALGPSRRRFANAVAVVESGKSPPALLARLKKIEREFGRRRGRRWGERALDLDIVGWSEGIWAGPGLSIPHPAFRDRRFVIAPLVEIAPGWRDPLTGLTPRHLLARLDRKRPAP